MSSAGDKSMANEGGGVILDFWLVVVILLSFVVVFVVFDVGLEEWREIVKENSWEGDEEDEGGEAGEIVTCCFEEEEEDCGGDF